MTDPTPENIKKLIEKLATRGEVIEEHDDGTKTFILCPILLGDVLKAMWDKSLFGGDLEKEILGNDEILLMLWQPCGFNCSLQDIIEDSGYRNQSVGNTGVVEERLRNKEARELAEFLLKVFNIT